MVEAAGLRPLSHHAITNSGTKETAKKTGPPFR